MTPAEIIARAISYDGKAGWNKRSAQAALAQLAVHGFAIVPIEPNMAMMDAGLYQSSHDSEWRHVFSAWKDMVAVAQEQSQ